MGEIKVDLLCEERVICANHSGYRLDIEAKAPIPERNVSMNCGGGRHGDLGMFVRAFLSGERSVATTQSESR